MPNNSRLFFVVLSIGAAIGIGNIFLYPYFRFNFSIIFFVPYIIALVFICVPLLMLEFASGQYFDKNIIDLFASIRKWFSSIGWLMIINSFILMGVYAVAMAWHIIYAFVSFGFQWQQSPRTYFFGSIIQASNGFNSFTKFSLPMFIALIIAWVIVFFCIRNGYETMKKSFTVILPVLLALMLFFSFYFLTLDNALAGAYSFLKSGFSGLLDLDLWFAAFSMAILSIGVSFGIMHAFGRKWDKGFAAANSFLIVLFEVIVSVALAFVMFAVFGFLEGRQLIAGTTEFSNYGDLLVTFSQALPFLHQPALLSLLFFGFLLLFFLLAVCALAYSMTHVIVHKFSARHFHASILVCGFGFLLGLVFIIKPGFYIMDIVHHFIYYDVLIALLLEAIAIGWFFNSEKLSSFLDQYSSIKLGKLWRFFIRFVIPPALLLLLGLQLKADILTRYNNYPLWALLVFGVGAVAVPLAVAFLLPQKILDRR